MPFESVAFNDSVEDWLSGTVLAPENANDVPTTCTVTVPVAVPDVTVTVMLRLLLLAPAANVAVATPVESVVAEAPVKMPLVVANVTAVDGKLTLPAPVTIAEMVTWSPPLPTCGELAKTLMAAAVDVGGGVVPVVPAVQAVEPVSGDAPASHPLLPQAASTSASANASITLIIRMKPAPANSMNSVVARLSAPRSARSRPWA
jgi:hypothetical protein